MRTNTLGFKQDTEIFRPKDLVGQRRMARDKKEFMLEVPSLLQTYSSDRKNNEIENPIFLDKPKNKMNS